MIRLEALGTAAFSDFAQASVNRMRHRIPAKRRLVLDDLSTERTVPSFIAFADEYPGRAIITPLNCRLQGLDARLVSPWRPEQGSPAAD